MLGKKSIAVDPDAQEQLLSENLRSGLAFTKKFGNGVSLYMKMLKLLSILFAFCGLLQVPALTAFFMGHGEGEAADLSMTTLANLPEKDSIGGEWAKGSERGDYCERGEHSE